MKNNYPLLIITARMGSKRFPGKVLKKIWQDYSILEFLIRRFQRIPEMSQLCLSTPATPENDVVAEVGDRCGICVVRGSEDDVVERMAQCLGNNNARYVGRITADNPLTDPILLRDQWHEMVKKGADYAYCKTVPVGTAADLWTQTCFHRTVQYATGAYEREHANAHVWNNKKMYRVLWYEPSGISEQSKNLSFTVDTRDDFIFLSKWINTLRDPFDFKIV